MRDVPTPISDADFDRIARFVSGEATIEERATTRRWIDADASRRAELVEVERAWHLAQEEALVNVEVAWSQLSKQIRDSGSSSRNNLRVLPNDKLTPWWRTTRAMQAAAALAVVAIGVAVLKPKSTTTSVAAVSAKGGVAYHTIAGERRQVRLPDGSVAKLGPMSTLTLTSQFDSVSGSTREMSLEGEALFEVVHNAARPFRVHALGSVIEDVGTEFAVRAYVGDERLRVAVASGSVSLRRGLSHDSAKVLTPRDVAVVPDTGEITLSRGVDVSPFTAFSTGKLVFANTPLGEVARELSRWFGVEVRVTDKALLDRHLNASFDAESLDTVLQVIGMTLRVRYDNSKQGVNFTGPTEAGVGGGEARTPASSAGTPARREAGV